MDLRKPHETNIEQVMREALEKIGLRKGIDFAQEYPLKHSFIIDFAFPEKKIAIECDGRKWHDTPSGRKRDAFKNLTLKRLGWKVFRFWDDEILEDVDKCISSFYNDLK